MTSPDIGPIDLQRIIKTLTREELEAYALLNALTVDSIMKQVDERASFALLMIPHGDKESDRLLSEALMLGQETTLKVQEEISKSSVRKN